jgi:hypothetical protein
MQIKIKDRKDAGVADAIINAPDEYFNSDSKNLSNAVNLSPAERKNISIQTLAKVSAVTEIAARNNVSRKFIYAQKEIADQALDQAFEPVVKDEKVLFYLPITKKWIQQFVLALILICHSSFRGVIEVLDSLFDYRKISLGTIHNIVMQAAQKAAVINGNENFSSIRYGAHDEIFQNATPVLVGMDVQSTYCYLLSVEDHRDETTWGVHLLELRERGLHPLFTIADGGKGMRAGQAAAWPDVACHGDVFHPERDFGKLARFLENRAAGATTKREKLESKMARAKKSGKGQKFSKALAIARQAEEKASRLAQEIRILSDWMRDDVLCLAGPDLATRQELFDFIVEQLEKRETLNKKIRTVRRTLKNQRGDLLAFANILEKRFDKLADQMGIPVYLVHAVCELHKEDQTNLTYWEKRETLYNKLKGNFFKVYEAVNNILKDTPRASSLVENLNSRLRNYFFLRRHIGNDYLELLRFFLNHRRFMRSDHPERKGLSPVEIMTGTRHPHWLESLEFERFCRN